MRLARALFASRSSINPDQIGTDYERLLAQAPARRTQGIFYTPPEVVDYIVEQTLAPLFAGKSPRDVRSVRILDPACGCGAFLLGAHRWLCRWYARQSDHVPTRAERRAIARRHLAGIDIDPAAVDLARQALGHEAGIAPHKLAGAIRQGDSLLEHDAWLNGRFAAVVTNPPYVNIRRLAASRGAGLADAYRRRYRCARGAFDLYVLFLERSVAALRPGGRIGAIVPNKLATLDYARQCRELLLGQGTLEAIADVSHLRLFGEAEVYPYIVVWAKQTPRPDHAIRVVRPSLVGRSFRAVQLNATRPTLILQSQQQAARGLTLSGDLHLESRVATAPLSEVCTIHSGATGFQAAELAARLVERAASGLEHSRSECSTWDFITSGNIDPYSIRLGDVRFMGSKLHRPLLAADDPILTDNKRQLYGSPKIVLAGMSRRLEAALDTRGLALGVQVYALAEWKIDPHYLLGLLNSSLLSHLFRLRFAAKRLAGGYYSLSKKQLGQLPIRLLDLSRQSERRLHDRLIDLVRRRLKSEARESRSAASLDLQIDDLVLRLYRVAGGEVAESRAAA
ncbi:MAG TPA: N-6 DNA methylase [Pirellulaceae bacterium]|nr:N-6 DNA methylase [Pirellulaceae bacterium]